VDEMPESVKPILYSGFKVSEALTVKQRIERVFFTEVYSLSDGRFLYVFTKAKPRTVANSSRRHNFVQLLVNEESYLAAVVETHSLELLGRMVEDLTTPRGLDGVAGMNELKAILINDVINPLLNPEKYQKFKLSIPNGILLFGPPGCGKTFIVKKLAEELDYNFIEMKPSLVATPWVHGAVGNIAKFFDSARTAAPSIIFIDEIEGLIPRREGLASHSDIKKEEINEFLLQLNNAGADRVLVVGATNRPEMIDTAIMRSGRMDKHIFIPPPDFEAREEMFQLCLNGRPYSATIDFKKLAHITGAFTGSDLELIVTEAARDAVKHDKLEIDETALLEAISKAKPSLTVSENCRLR
jgi:transitional endoplasmic reticulum ATPase